MNGCAERFLRRAGWPRLRKNQATRSACRSNIRPNLPLGAGIAALVGARKPAIADHIRRQYRCEFAGPGPRAARRVARLTTNFETGSTLLQCISLLMADSVEKVARPIAEVECASQQSR